jgi:hypothetical protein
MNGNMSVDFSDIVDDAARRLSNFFPKDLL